MLYLLLRLDFVLFCAVYVFMAVGCVLGLSWMTRKKISVKNNDVTEGTTHRHHVRLLAGLRCHTVTGDTTSWHFACYSGYICCRHDMSLVCVHQCVDIWSTVFFMGVSLILHVSVKH